VKLETPNNNGNTPLSIACQHRRLDIAELLLRMNVNMQPVNKKGSTPFFFACQEGNLDVVKFLARNGVDMTHGKNGISPFHMACYRGHLEVVTYLVVEHDVDPSAIDGSGRTPLDVARKAGKELVIEFLEQVEKEKGASGSARPSGEEEQGSCVNACSGQEGCVIS
jgi:ankyrin repeat protein